MTPLKLLVALLFPAVSVYVLDPAVLSTVPAPDNPLMDELNPPKSNVPVTERFPLPDPDGISFAAPCFNVPALIVVAPLYVLLPDNVSVPDPFNVKANA